MIWFMYPLVIPLFIINESSINSQIHCVWWSWWSSRLLKLNAIRRSKNSTDPQLFLPWASKKKKISRGRLLWRFDINRTEWKWKGSGCRRSDAVGEKKNWLSLSCRWAAGKPGLPQQAAMDHDGKKSICFRFHALLCYCGLHTIMKIKRMEKIHRSQGQWWSRCSGLIGRYLWIFWPIRTALVRFSYDLSNGLPVCYYPD